jgi:hypothetical protein
MPEHSGALYLKINEAAGGLYDNRGELRITLHMINTEN